MNRDSIKLIAAGVTFAALTGAPALATDLPSKPRIVTKAPVQAPLPSWTGFYLGANAGVGVSQTRISVEEAEGSLNRAGAGFAGGAQLGANWQFAPHLVAGVEADIGYLGIDRSLRGIDIDLIFGVKTDWYGTVRGRLGYTNGPSLFYATGGLAYVKVTNNIDDPGNNVFASRTETARGWTAGAGLETMLGGNWSARIEYLYIDAGSQDVLLIDEANDQATNAHFENRFHIFRYGLNYRFVGSGAAVALPAHNWSGFYAGVNGGAALSQVSINVEGLVGRNDIAGSGVTGGLQAGYNWQTGSPWVVGIEADIGWLGIDRSFQAFDDVAAPGVKTSWYSTARGRLGYSTGPALLYATGGAAFVDVKNNVFDSAVAFSTRSIAIGWTAGAGIEAALGRDWSAKAEYLYLDVGQQYVQFGMPVEFDNHFHVFRFGLNRKFGS